MGDNFYDLIDDIQRAYAAKCSEPETLRGELVTLHDDYNALQEKFSAVVKELDIAKAKLQALEDIHRKTAAIMGGQLI